MRRKIIWIGLVGLILSGALLTLPPLSARGGSSRVEATEDASGAQLTETPRRPSQNLDILYDLQEAFESVAENVLPTVVEVNTLSSVQRNNELRSPWEFFFRQQPRQEEFQLPGLGSGVIVRRNRRSVYVLTNNHVVGNAENISVRLNDGREFEAEVIGTDERIDLALISFETADDVPVAVLGDSDKLRVGNWVLAIGNPLGFESTVTAGIVSAVHRQANGNSSISSLTDYIQTDAAINRGNSGGALVNLSGEIVGINTWIASNNSGGNIGLGFSIPINTAKETIDDFINEGEIVYGWLGVNLFDVDDAQDAEIFAKELGVENLMGAMISSVFRGSPAEKSEILPGDFITRVNDEAINGRSHLARVVGNIDPKSEAQFELIRDGRTERISALLERRKQSDNIDESDSWPGIIVLPLTDELRDRLEINSNIRGVFVAAVRRDTPADARLEVDDIITAVADRSVRNLREFYRELNRNRSDAMEITVERTGRTDKVRLPGL